MGTISRLMVYPVKSCAGVELREAVLTDTGLRERAFGVFEGLTWAEIERDHPVESERWRRREPDFGPAGGEVLADFYERCVGSVTALAEALSRPSIMFPDAPASPDAS